MTATTETTSTAADFQTGQAVILTGPWTIHGAPNIYMQNRTRQGQLLEFRGTASESANVAQVASPAFSYERLVDVSLLAPAEFSAGELVEVCSYRDTEQVSTKQVRLGSCGCFEDGCSWLTDEDGGSLISKDGSGLSGNRVLVKIDEPEPEQDERLKTYEVLTEFLVEGFEDGGWHPSYAGHKVWITPEPVYGNIYGTVSVDPNGTTTSALSGGYSGMSARNTYDYLPESWENSVGWCITRTTRDRFLARHAELERTDGGLGQPTAEPIQVDRVDPWDLPVGTMFKDRDRDLWIKTGQSAYRMWSSVTCSWNPENVYTAPSQMTYGPYSTEVTDADLMNKNFATWEAIERSQLADGDLVEIRFQHDVESNRSRHVGKVKLDGHFLVMVREDASVWEYEPLSRLVVGTPSGWGGGIGDVRKLVKADLPPIAGSDLAETPVSYTHEGVTYTEGDSVAIVRDGTRNEGVLRTGGIYVPETLSMDLPSGGQYLVFDRDGRLRPQSISKLETPVTAPVERTPEEIERDRMQERISVLERELVQARQNHRKDVERIGDRLIKESEERDWCSEYDGVINDLNGELTIELPRRMREYEVAIEVVYRITKTVTASGYDEAWEEARDNFELSDLDYESPQSVTHIDTYEA